MHIPIAFMVESRFRIVPVERGLGGLRLVEEPVTPYVKDYDAADGGPSGWPHRWDISNWGILVAYEGNRLVGGAAVAWKTKELLMLGGPAGSAVLWDLRSRSELPRHRCRWAFFANALDWARGRDCRRLKVETQNTNLPACRFYARQGCELISINEDAYPDLVDEVQLIWAKELSTRYVADVERDHLSDQACHNLPGSSAQGSPGSP